MSIKIVRIFAVLLSVVLSLAIFVFLSIKTVEIEVPQSLRGNAPGDIVRVHRIGNYPAFAMRYVLGTVETTDPIDLNSGAVLYRLEYLTTQFNGKLVTASGLVSIPRNKLADSTVMYFHGTSAQRNSAPSSKGLGEGLLVSAAVNGMGSLLVAPDYIGLGQSYDFHPYLHTETVVSTSLDMLKASRKLVSIMGVEWPGALFLLGFSQGGHATFAVQRELESMTNPEFQVTASAPIAGAFQLRNISFPQALTGLTDSHEFYLGYMASAYSVIYNQRLNTILIDSYAEAIYPVYDGEHSTEEIAAVLPELPIEMFQQEFLDQYYGGESNWFLEELAQNQVFDWTPKAPVRVYYGESDLDVSPQEALDAAASMAKRGSDIMAISVGPLDHDESALASIPIALAWFRELDSSRY